VRPERIAFADYETRSLVDLKKCGQDVYANDRSTEVLMVGVLDTGFKQPKCFRSLEDFSRLRDRTIVTWGGFDKKIFERVEWSKVGRVEWFDLMPIAYFLGLPAKLEDCARALGIEVRKDPAGKRLINKYSKPIRGTNEFRDLFADENESDYYAFIEYCLQDVRLLRDMYVMLKPAIPEWETHVRENYELVERMNERGVPIDLPSARDAIKVLNQAGEDLRAECKRLCGCSPTQVAQVGDFLELDNLRRETVEDALGDAEIIWTPEQQRVAEIRLETAKASVKKLERMVAMAPTGRAHGCFTNNGAHTGRLTSSGVQFQNMMRTEYDPEIFMMLQEGAWIPDPFRTISEASRGFILAPPGRLFIASDLAQIECRACAVLAGEWKLVEAFKRGFDVYSLMAEEVFGIPSARITGDQRQVGKVVVLAGQYGVWGGGLLGQGKGYGINKTEEEWSEVASVYRATFPKIVSLWGELEWAFLDLVVTKKERLTVWVADGRIKMERSGSFVKVTLPSGRPLWYYKPRLVKRLHVREIVRPDGTIEMQEYWKDHIQYRSRYGYVDTYGGKLTENFVQAMCADIILHGKKNLEMAGFELILSIHDEAVAEISEGEASDELQGQFNALLCAQEPWASEIPIEAKGWIGPRFKK
jgi:DNA polymerase